MNRGDFTLTNAHLRHHVTFKNMGFEVKLIVTITLTIITYCLQRFSILTLLNFKVRH
jgi:hypothetical protein